MINVINLLFYLSTGMSKISKCADWRRHLQTGLWHVSSIYNISMVISRVKHWIPIGASLQIHTRKTNSAICSLATVASRAQSVHASNCYTLYCQSVAVRRTHTLGAWRHCRERGNCRVRFPCTLRKNPGHSDVIYVVENVLDYFLWLNSSNGWPVNVDTKSGRSD